MQLLNYQRYPQMGSEESFYLVSMQPKRKGTHNKGQIGREIDPNMEPRTQRKKKLAQVYRKNNDSCAGNPRGQRNFAKCRSQKKPSM
jgi:hypothetical protein